MRRYKAIWRKDDGADNAGNENGRACNVRNVMREVRSAKGEVRNVMCEVRKAKCETEVEIKQPTRSAGGTDTRLASSPRM